MTDRVGVRALQQNASSVVSRAAAGETIEITDRGRPVAQIVPLGKGRLATLVTAGLARPARRNIKELPPPLSASGERSLGDLLAEARSNER